MVHCKLQFFFFFWYQIAMNISIKHAYQAVDLQSLFIISVFALTMFYCIYRPAMLSWPRRTGLCLWMESPHLL